MSTPDPEIPIGRNRRADLVRSLTSAGWFAYVAWLLFVFRQADRVTQVGEQRFAGLWDQRIEVMSFITLPPNMLILVPAAIASATATWLAGPNQTIDLAIQIRMVQWSAVAQALVAAVSAVSIVVNETGSPTEGQDLSMRFAGLAMSVSLVLVTRAVERSSPAWETTR